MATVIWILASSGRQLKKCARDAVDTMATVILQGNRAGTCTYHVASNGSHKTHVQLTMYEQLDIRSYDGVSTLCEEHVYHTVQDKHVGRLHTDRVQNPDSVG